MVSNLLYPYPIWVRESFQGVRGKPSFYLIHMRGELRRIITTTVWAMYSPLAVERWPDE